MNIAPPDNRSADRLFVLVLFVAALGMHFYLATINWTYGCMPGHEFRQTQTAIITYYIDQENNFSPHYSTPIMGKPWEIPLEFPFYEWCVVWSSRATGWNHVTAARTISLTSFYLSLPALFLVLGHVGLDRTRRLLALALLLVTPVYIFYSRAFLIDPMAVMFSAWFLALFVESMRQRRLALLLACTACGTAAGLIKSLVLMAWVAPAAIYGAYCLWVDIRDKRGARTIVQTLAWGLGAVVVPAIAMLWWVRLTDAVKAAHASAYIFTSENLSHGNYGTFSLSARVSWETWKELLARWREAIAAPWLIGAIVLLGLLFLKRERWKIAGAAGLFLFAQLVIPYAYARQDYYFYICAAFIVFAFAFVLHGVLDAPLPRWCRWVLVLIPFVGLLHAHRQSYFVWQSVKSTGGTALTMTLRDTLPRQSIIIVAGDDWSAIIPYYSEHRALMIRNGLEHDSRYLSRAFADLKGEDIGALVLIGAQRSNSELVDRTVSAFGLDPSAVYSWADEADVYVHRRYRAEMTEKLRAGTQYPEIAVLKPKPSVNSIPRESWPPGKMAESFSMFHPAPSAFHLPSGFGTSTMGASTLLHAHPDSDVWLPAPAGSKSIDLAFGIEPGAYEKPGAQTSGVLFEVVAEARDGSTRPIFSRVLDPAADPNDRGMQKATCELKLEAGEEVVLRTRPYGGYSFDWAYWSDVSIR